MMLDMMSPCGLLRVGTGCLHVCVGKNVAGMTEERGSPGLAAEPTRCDAHVQEGASNVMSLTSGLAQPSHSINMLQRMSRGSLRAVSLRRTLPRGNRNMSSCFSVNALDHVVLTARSIPKTIEFYTQRLGMRHEVFTAQGGERHALVFGNQKLNLHQAGSEFEPKAGCVQPGSGDLCFITDYPVDQVLEDWRGSGVEVSCCLNV